MAEQFQEGTGTERVEHRPAGSNEDDIVLLAAIRAAATTVVEDVGILLGAADRLLRTTREQVEAAKRQAGASLERATTNARDNGARQATDLRRQLVDCTDRLVPKPFAKILADSGTTDALAVAEFVTLGVIQPDGRTGAGGDNSVPAVIALLNRGNLTVRADPTDARLVAILHRIVLHSLLETGPGQLSIESFDPCLRATVAPFVTLRSAAEELLPNSRSTEDELNNLLTDLTADIKRITELFRGQPLTLGRYRRETAQPIEGFKLVVVRDFPLGWSPRAMQSLRTLLVSGPPCGISFLTHLNPAEFSLDGAPGDWIVPQTTAIDLHTTAQPRLSFAPRYQFHPSPPVELGTIETAMKAIVVAARAAAAPRISFTDLHAGIQAWSRSSADGITAIIGRSGHEPATITLGDETTQRHNVLVSGAVGQGKSNLLMALVHSLAWQYGPDELRMYLLDLKEGLTLYPLAPHPPAQLDFLPHAAVLGLESDKAFAVAVLNDLVMEFERRATIIRSSADNIARYRKANPTAAMPRLLVVIDEFHKLFQGDDASTTAAIASIEHLAREGRAYGIHLVLASQTLSGITALLAKQDGIFAQFPVRLALKNSAAESRVVLDPHNTEAARLRFRGEIIVNQEFGSAESNPRAVVADADLTELAALRRTLWARNPAADSPRVFNGSRPADLLDALDDLHELRRRAQHGTDERVALVGREISTLSYSTGFTLSSSAGSHLAVLGTGSPQRLRSGGIMADTTRNATNANLALGALTTAVISIALQHPRCDAEFVLIDALDATSWDNANLGGVTMLLEHLGQSVRVLRNTEIAEFFVNLEQQLPGRERGIPALYVIGLGLDRVNLNVSNGFTKPADGLRALLRTGPSTRAHLLGWWASMSSFNDCLGFEAQGTMAGLLVLGVQQSELSGLLGPFVTWNFVNNRALLHQGGGGDATTIIPMRPPDRAALHTLTTTEWD